MRGPALRRKLVLERQARISDGAGGAQVTWQEVAALWAEVTPVSGRRLAGEERVSSVVAYRVTLRATALPEAEMPRAGDRFRMGDRRLLVLSAALAEAAGRYLQCNCQEEGG